MGATWNVAVDSWVTNAFPFPQSVRILCRYFSLYDKRALWLRRGTRRWTAGSPTHFLSHKACVSCVDTFLYMINARFGCDVERGGGQLGHQRISFPTKRAY